MLLRANVGPSHFWRHWVWDSLVYFLKRAINDWFCNKVVVSTNLSVKSFQIFLKIDTYSDLIKAATPNSNIYSPHSYSFNCIIQKKLGVRILNSLLLTIPAHSYFWPKSEEHNVTCAIYRRPVRTSKNTLVRMCEIDQERGIQSWVAISALF